MMGGAPFRRTTTGDFFDAGANQKQRLTMIGARLLGGTTNSSAQITDVDGTVIADLSCLANTSDECSIPVRFVGKLTLATIVGTGAAVTVYVK